MKQASAATLAILASGQYAIALLIDLTLTTGATYHFTDWDTAITAGIYSGGSVGAANTYQTGYTISRGSFNQDTGMDVTSVDLNIWPQADNPGGVPLLDGMTIQQVAALGLLDRAQVNISKIFLQVPSTAGVPLTVSQGAVLWYVGNIQDIATGRTNVVLKVADYMQYLTTQMPRNVYQSGCPHTLFDAGCTLSEASFTTSGTVSGTPLVTGFNTSLTQADHYFEQGELTFTSGVNDGFSAVVSTSYFSSGALTFCYPFPYVPSAGDTFTIFPGDDKSQATCTTKFSNLAHFKGLPYVPQPETLYDGGTSQPPNTAPLGSQTGQIVGSTAGGVRLPGSLLQ